VLRYIRRARNMAIVLGAHNESECWPWGSFRSLELTVYPWKDGTIGKRRELRRGRFWVTWLVSSAMCELHAGFDTKRRF